MTKRTAREINLDIKECILRLLDAAKPRERANRERIIVTLELLNLQKELERRIEEENHGSPPLTPVINL